MSWTLTNLIIQAVMGILGAHVAAIAAREHGFGFIGHTLVGLIGGAVSGYFLQTLAVTMVTGNGSLNEPTVAENIILQGLAGAGVGGCLMLIVGLVRHALNDHMARKTSPVERP